MAVKKVHYYTIDVKNKNTEQLMNTEEAMQLLREEIESRCRENGNNYFAINQQGNIYDRVNIDILINDREFLFGRAGKYKDSSEALVRDIETNETDTVGDERTYLEIYTYFLVDCINGIIGYVYGSSAPNVQILKNIIENDMYEMELGNIVSGDTVRSLMTPGATLGKISYRYRIPDIRVLTYLGLTREAVAQLAETDYKNIEITIKNEPRKSLTGDSGIIGRLIDSFTNNRGVDKKLFKGKTPNTVSQDYKFELENYTTKIDVPTSRVENGQLVRYDLEEIATDVNLRLMAVYRKNIEHILIFANRQE